MLEDHTCDNVQKEDGSLGVGSSLHDAVVSSLVNEEDNKTSNHTPEKDYLQKDVKVANELSCAYEKAVNDALVTVATSFSVEVDVANYAI